jgi:ATPase family associated with various cellular activities (AAA)
MTAVSIITRHIDSAAEAVTEPVSSASVLELILLRVRLRAQRRAAWLTHLGNKPEEGTRIALDANPAAHLDGRDTPEAEAAWYQRAEVVQVLNEELERVEQALAGESGTRLQQLHSLFRLSEPEMDLLQTCLAPAIDPGLGMAYAYLQQYPARSYATEALAGRLFGYGRRSMVHAGGPLAAWGLVSAGEAASGEPAPLAADPFIIDWLQGELRMDPALVGLMQIVEPRKPLESWPVEMTARLIQHAIEREPAVRVLLAGPPSSGRRTFAAAVAARFGIQLLAVDTTEISDTEWPDIFMRAQRLAVMSGAALVWHGSRLDRCWPGNVAPAPIQFVACDPDHVVHPCEYVIDYRIDISTPTLDERRRLWQANIPESATWPVHDLETLVTRYRLNAGDIVSVARRAPASAREAAAYARELTRHWLGELGRLLDCPFTWDDLVVPERLCEALEDFAFEARDRATFWERPGARRLFPRGRGLVALFSGPPGTGKTMAAQIVAADLDLDLFRIDLATVVSKYIGETAKHLAQIFARASGMNGVLLFDEADALFSKRTEVKDSHDRYANADTSYLLQLLEEYRGIVILATNKKQNIDPAFIRRVRYVFEFPRPDAAERGRIWRQVIGELSGDETLKRLETTIEALAANVELSGAQIKNAVLASIFVGRRSREPLAMAHLLRGIERELGKEGRLVGTRERERLIRDA